MNDLIKFYNLNEKVNEAIINNTESNYLDFVFEMGIHGLGIEGKERKISHDSFVNSFCDLYDSYRKEGKNEEEAKFSAMYHITKKFIV